MFIVHKYNGDDEVHNSNKFLEYQPEWDRKIYKLKIGKVEKYTVENWQNSTLNEQ